jgi:hypothetical protein
MFNFHSTFLNGILDSDEEVSMEQLPSYEESDPRKYCVRLYKSIYRLKQARHKWYEIVCHTLSDIGFRKSKANPAVFYIHSGTHIIILAIHVNNCTITGSSTTLLCDIKSKIKAKYEFTDLGAINWLLGIKIT